MLENFYLFYKTLFLCVVKIRNENTSTVTNQILSDLLKRFSRLKILIIGDVMLDSYLWGSVSRISPEAPVPVVAQSKSEYRLGGAANVARNIKSLGAEPVLCSAIGEDIHSEVFTDLMKTEGMIIEGILKSKNRITTVKTRIISGSQHLLRVDNEMEDYLYASLESSMFGNIETLIKKSKIDAIIFQDYDKGVITPMLIENVTSLAGKEKIPILVDPKKRNFHHYQGATLFKPNFKELTEGLHIHIEKRNFDSVFNAAKLLHNNHAHMLVMITLSELGILISDNINYEVIPAEVRDISDVSGAGDTVIGMAALCLAAGLTPKQTAALSNLAGGLVCEKIGVVPIEKEQLLKENFILPTD